MNTIGAGEPTSSAQQHRPVTKKRRAGRKKFKETRHPVYRGVRERSGGKWVCEVREPKNKGGGRIWLGTYASPEMAARAHDVAALSHHGDSAHLNFPDSAWLLPRSRSDLPADVREAAARAARMFDLSDGWMLETEGELFVDEEEIFNMPAVLQSMAEGLLIPPPPSVQGDLKEDGFDADMSLWSV